MTLDAVAICHSDILFAEGGWGGTLPAVYGHEAAGRVSAVGPNVQGLAEGDSVVVTLIRACGSCPNCASGQPTICETPQAPEGPLQTADGAPLFQAMNTGGFAEKVVVDRSQAVKISHDIPKDAACLIACGVITGVGAVVNAAGLRAGQDVVVIGAGGVGLNAIQGARIAGARRIVAVDMTEEKLAYETAPRYLAAGGRVIMVGMPHSGAEASYEPVVLAALGQGMVGSKMGDVVIQRDIPWMVDLYLQGRLQLDSLISGRWRLDQINEAIADTKTGAAKRNVIIFDRT